MSYSVYLVKNRAGFFLDFEHPTLQGENAVVYSLPRAPLRSALGYEQVAPPGRTDGIIPPMITTQQGTDGIIPPMITTQQGTDGIIPPIISTRSNWFFRA